MSLRIAARCLALTCLCLAAGCDRTASAPAATSGGSTQEASATVDAGKGDGYAYHIRYPQLPADAQILNDALRTYAATAKKEFLAARAADPGATAGAYNLDLEFTIARRTSDFLSISANGSSYTGGAHPMPLLATFNLHVDSGKVIGLGDLFTDADAAYKALSEEARRQLEGRAEAEQRDSMPAKGRADALKSMREWIERGTEAKPENFSVFLVDGIDAKAIGLTLIFPPYQVASYADGPQQVEVPAKIFYELLKPEYRNAFQIDTEANRLPPGVR